MTFLIITIICLLAIVAGILFLPFASRHWRKCGYCPNYFSQYGDTAASPPRGDVVMLSVGTCPDCATKSTLANWSEIQRRDMLAKGREIKSNTAMRMAEGAD